MLEASVGNQAIVLAVIATLALLGGFLYLISCISKDPDSTYNGLGLPSRTYFRISDADHPMIHPTSFDTFEEAKEVLDEEYTNRDMKDGHDAYWKSRHTVIEKVTVRVETVYSNQGD